MKIRIINGPNLNLLGRREIEIYGIRSFDEYLDSLKKIFTNYTLDYFQTNVEGEIINSLHEAEFNYDGIIINAGGYTHTSIAIGDAIKALTIPVVEVHISNIFSREQFRNTSFIAPNAAGIIAGFGLDAYRLAILALENIGKKSKGLQAL
jgi:3-dehydroquinate dehydratase-2